MATTTLKIRPRTSGTLSCAIKGKNPSTGVTENVLDGAATADIVKPDGTRAASDVSLTHAGLGVYLLQIDPEWSTNGEASIVGVFTAQITVVRGLQQLFTSIQYLVHES